MEVLQNDEEIRKHLIELAQNIIEKQEENAWDKITWEKLQKDIERIHGELEVRSKL